MQMEHRGRMVRTSNSLPEGRGFESRRGICEQDTLKSTAELPNAKWHNSHGKLAICKLLPLSLIAFFFCQLRKRTQKLPKILLNYQNLLA
jgi:hypothetical protein